MSRIQELRGQSFERQAGKCYYCRQPMWHEQSDAFARSHGISPAKARHLKATAEHLTPRSDGGADSDQNIVAACTYCNGHRHRARVILPPERYQSKVRARLAQGKWHGLRLT